MSTTMMRSFGARKDTICVDEPFYAAYLRLTGLQHPMVDEIMERHECDPAKVSDSLGSNPKGYSVFYQKHMTHHMVDGIPRDFMSGVTNVFLIRHPARVLASYARKMETVSLEATGFPQQLALFRKASHFSARTPIVIDSDDILKSPETELQALCNALGLPWDKAMLSWRPGPREEDGAWAPHWYDAVWRSTGFGPAPGPLPDLSQDLADLCRQAMPIYRELSAHKIVSG